MVVNSWSDHQGNWRGTEFSSDTPPKISKLCHRVTVVGAERSIPLRGTRTFCEGPAELQPHILGPAVLREQQILYHDLRRIARRGGIFFADPVLRGRLPAMRIHSGAGAGVRRSAGKIPAVWSGGPALRPDVCRSEPGGHAVSRRPLAAVPSGGLPGGCSVGRSRPAAMGGGSALRPDVCRCEPGGHAVGRRPWRPFRLGAARRPFRRRQRAPIQSAWRASRRKTGMVASGAAAVTVRPPGWTAPVCSSVQSAPAGR